MKPETKIIIFLLLLSPVLGELLSASAPPFLFFNPLMFLPLILLYGCGTLLIREAKVRWNLQWSVIFLALAYNIVEEGLIVQSFFNIGHEDLGASAGYGMYFGVQWPWSISLAFFHATMSTLVPIAITGLLWPDSKDKPLLKKRGIILCFSGIILLTLCWIILITRNVFPTFQNYAMNPVVLAASFIAVILLVALAHKYRQTRISTNNPIFPSFVFGIFGFLFFPVALVFPNLLIEGKIPAITIILIQLIIGFLVLIFVFCQIYNQRITKRHIVSLIFGMVLFWILLTPLHEFNLIKNPDPTQGMLAVGIIILILLIIWRKSALKKQ